MINESDMNEKAFRASTREGKVYAKDGGLMAIRCVVDHKDRCVNGNVRGLAWKQLMDPVTNIEAGIKHLKSLLERFPLTLALAAYNAGEAAVERFRGVPPYRETRNYVSRILDLVAR